MSGAAEKEFPLLIKGSNALIHKICRMYRDSPEDREDLFQEITFQLWKSYPSFKGMAKPSTWVYRVALNTAIASFRKKRPEISYLDILPDVQEEMPGEDDAYWEDRLFRVLKKFDAADKALITLYLEDLSYHEISEILGISENYVGVKISRLKSKLKNELTKQDGN